MSMRHRIWIEKAMMILHLRGLEESALARRIWKEQREWDWPGLAKDICKVLGVEDVNEIEYEKKENRVKLIKACKVKGEEEIKAKMGVKCEEMKDEDSLLKSYFQELTLYEARARFKLKSNMNKIRGNYKNMPATKQPGGSV